MAAIPCWTPEDLPPDDLDHRCRAPRRRETELVEVGDILVDASGRRMLVELVESDGALRLTPRARPGARR